MQVLAIIFDRVAETALYVLEETYEEKLVALKKVFSWTFLGLLAKTFHRVVVVLLFQKKNFVTNHSSEENTRRFRILVEVFFRFFAGSFCQVRRNCILGVERYTFLEKVCLGKKQTFFQVRTLNNFLQFWDFFSTSLQNLHSTCPCAHSEEKMFSFLTGSFLLVLGIWPVNFWTFILTLFVSLVKTAFEVSRATIWSKLKTLRNKQMFHHFSVLNEKYSVLLVKNSGTFVRFALACPSYVSRKSFFWN